jgi:hypothetical protein
MAALVFCQCGSDRVGVTNWNVNRARLHCFTCGRESWLDGFTISEFDPSKLLAAALLDQARKHRKRPPEEIRKIVEQRGVKNA